MKNHNSVMSRRVVGASLTELHEMLSYVQAACSLVATCWQGIADCDGHAHTCRMLLWQHADAMRCLADDMQRMLRESTVNRMSLTEQPS